MITQNIIFPSYIHGHITKYKRRKGEQFLRSALKGERPTLPAFLLPDWNADMMAGAGAAIMNNDMELRMENTTKKRPGSLTAWRSTSVLD